MRLCLCVLSSPGEPDHARGLLEILRAAATSKELRYESLLHVYGLSRKEWQEGYLADQELRTPTRLGERGRADRLNAGVQLAAETGADYALLLEADLWPLRAHLLHAYLRRVQLRAQLLGGAAMARCGRMEPPAEGIWPRFLILDLAWQRSKKLFPLDFERYAEGVLLRSDRWTVPTLAGCLSASYFRRITEATPVEAARELALSQLTRFEEIEPILLREHAEQWTWHAHALVRDPRASERASLVRRLDAAEYGPTLQRLAAFGGADHWFNSVHAHPSGREREA